MQPTSPFHPDAKHRAYTQEGKPSKMDRPRTNKRYKAGWSRYRSGPADASDFTARGRTSGRPAPSCNTTSAPRCAGAPAGMDWLRTQPVPLNATRSPSRSSR